MENTTILSFFNEILDNDIEKKIIDMLYMGYSNDQIIEELIKLLKEGGATD